LLLQERGLPCHSFEVNLLDEELSKFWHSEIANGKGDAQELSLVLFNSFASHIADGLR